MPTISSQAGTLSDFPTALDSFDQHLDGTTARSLTKAEYWNKIEAAIYQTQMHASGGVRIYGDSGDRKLLRLSQIVEVTGTPEDEFVLFTLTEAEKRFLRNNPFQSGTNLWASARYLGGTTTSVRAFAWPTTYYRVWVLLDRADQSQNLVDGDYQVHLNIWGV